MFTFTALILRLKGRFWHMSVSMFSRTESLHTYCIENKMQVTIVQFSNATDKLKSGKCMYIQSKISYYHLDRKLYLVSFHHFSLNHTVQLRLKQRLEIYWPHCSPEKWASSNKASIIPELWLKKQFVDNN